MDFSSLPPHLVERCRWSEPRGERSGELNTDFASAVPSRVNRDGEFVLYWMHHAVRGHENPSLDVAMWSAHELGLPLLVYHALSEDYPYASDRHHAFILQGARDIQREMEQRGVSYAFHLQREGHRGSHLVTLSRRAALVVSDEMPVSPITHWIERLSCVSRTPIICVDSSCIVPAIVVDKAHTRAFEYRSATKRLYADRISREYDEQTITCQRYQGELPFISADLQRADLGELIGQCRIDHLIAPVADTPGGSRAGYMRWQAFKVSGLASYARRRNHAEDHAGVSRMSPYLHFGMVSPMRLAREAQLAGAEKFLDELLIWRELAFHYCFHHHDRLETLEALPRWARQTLEEHSVDPRHTVASWESLARGRSGHPLWDACQRSLLRHGELHNNVRMTWGKSMLHYAHSPQRSLHLAIDLNHRYALDGRDPSSYGGILWCFGQFDRPFSPTRSVLGSVRPRDADAHQQRIDLRRYQEIVNRPIAASLPRVAVVGAGMAGLIAARTLADHGIEVEIFEKSRGVGGRMATRRTPCGLTFDHGAQYFTTRDARFNRYVKSWIEDGIVQPWQGRVVEIRNGSITAEKSDTARFVGVPTMNALTRHLADGLTVRRETTVQSLQRSCVGGVRRWELLSADREALGEYDCVVVNCPPAQASALLRPHTSLAQTIDQGSMRPCWAVMVQTQSLNDLPYDGAFVADNPLSWMSRNDSKPGRTNQHGSCWVFHANPDWSQRHLEMSADEVLPLLLSAAGEATGRDVQPMTDAAAHRWRFAIPLGSLDREALWDPIECLGACGDWCAGPRVEGAFLSGSAMAGELLRRVTIDRPAASERHVMDSTPS